MRAFVFPASIPAETVRIHLNNECQIPKCVSFYSALSPLFCWKLKLMNACEIGYMPHVVPILPHDNTFIYTCWILFKKYWIHLFHECSFRFVSLAGRFYSFILNFHSKILPPVFPFDVISGALCSAACVCLCVCVWARVHCDLQMWIIYAFIACALISMWFRLCGARVVGKLTCAAVGLWNL